MDHGTAAAIHMREQHFCQIHGQKFNLDSNLKKRPVYSCPKICRIARAMNDRSRHIERIAFEGFRFNPAY
jgi:hypothetical protein